MPTLVLQPPAYLGSADGLIAKYTLNFYTGSTQRIQIHSSFQGDPVRPVSCYVDNYDNDAPIDYTMGNLSGLIPANSAGYIPLSNADFISFTCDNLIAVEIAIENVERPYGFVSSGIHGTLYNSSILLGENVLPGDVIVYDANSKGYWANNPALPLGGARPVNNAALAHNVLLSDNPAEDEYINLDPREPLIYDPKVGNTFSSYQLGIGGTIDFFVDDTLTNPFQLNFFGTNPDFTPSTDIGGGTGGANYKAFSTTKQGNYIAWAEVMALPLETAIVYNYKEDTSLNPSEWLDTVITVDFDIVSGLPTGYKMKFDATATNLYCVAGDAYNYVSCINVSADGLDTINGSFLVSDPGAGPTADILSNQFDFAVLADGNLAFIYPRLDALGTTTEIFFRVTTPLGVDVIAETSFAIPILAVHPFTDVKILELSNGNLLFTICGITGAVWSLYDSAGANITSGAIPGTANSADICEAHPDSTPGYFAVAYADNVTGGNVTIIYCDDTGSVLYTYVAEAALDCSGMPIFIKSLSCLDSVNYDLDVLINSFWVSYKADAGTVINSIQLDLTLTPIGVKKTSACVDYGGYCVNEITSPLQLPTENIIKILCADTAFTKQYLYASQVPRLTPIGVSPVAGLSGAASAIKIRGSVTTRIDFTPVYSVNAQAQTPPGQKMSLVGNLANLEGLVA